MLLELTIFSVYQEFLAKSLTDKYNHLNVQMDRLVNEANSELEVINRKLSGMLFVSFAWASLIDIVTTAACY